MILCLSLTVIRMVVIKCWWQPCLSVTWETAADVVPFFRTTTHWQLISSHLEVWWDVSKCKEGDKTWAVLCGSCVWPLSPSAHGIYEEQRCMGRRCVQAPCHMKSLIWEQLMPELWDFPFKVVRESQTIRLFVKYGIWIRSVCFP